MKKPKEAELRRHDTTRILRSTICCCCAFSGVDASASQSGAYIPETSPTKLSNGAATGRRGDGTMATGYLTLASLGAAKQKRETGNRKHFMSERENESRRAAGIPESRIHGTLQTTSVCEGPHHAIMPCTQPASCAEIRRPVLLAVHEAIILGNVGEDVVPKIAGKATSKSMSCILNCLILMFNDT